MGMARASLALRARHVPVAMSSGRSGKPAGHDVLTLEGASAHLPFDDPELPPLDVLIDEHRGWRADLPGLV